ncbi:hypothetical protein ABIA61_001794 [Paenibacillus sp. RC21]
MKYNIVHDCNYNRSQVAPYVGAWIEIRYDIEGTYWLLLVAPYVERRLKFINNKS